MALPIKPNNPNIPIPNNPFSAPLNPYLQGPYFPFVAGSGVDLNTPGLPTITNDVAAVLAAGSGISLSTTSGVTTITATGGGGGGSGTVTSITAGTGLTGGTITTSGTIALANTAVTPGSYTNANITVDQQGRITLAANGTPGGVTSVTGTTPISVTAGATPVVSVATATATAAGVVELATDAETQAGTATTLAVTPAGAAATYVPLADYATKGNILAATGASTPVALPVGADGLVLTTDATCAEGLKWAASSATPATPLVEGIVYGCTDSTNFNYGLGDGILGALTTGTLNIAIGAGALVSTDTGTSNTVVGIGALYTNTSGTQNVALGQQALFANVVGVNSTAIGSQALQNALGSNNTAVGNFAGNLVTTGCFNILIGDQAGGAGAGALDTGDCNVVIGNRISVANNAGSNQLAIGMDTFCWLSGTSTGAIKPGAGIIDCAGSCGTAGQALLSDGANAVCWGSVSAARACPTTLGTVYGYVGTNAKNDASIGIGLCSMVSSTPANTPTNAALGFGTLCSLTTGGGNVAMGWRSLITMTTGDGNTAVGAQAGTAASGTANVFIGGQSGCQVAGNQNSFFGACSGCTQVSGDANVAIGTNVALASTTGSCQLAIGFSGTDNWLTGDSTKAIKPGAGIIDCASSTGTAGQVLMSNGSNAICWGALPAATPTVAGIVKGCIDATNTALGCNALVANTTGLSNTVIGTSAGAALDDACFNTLIGKSAGCALDFGTGHTVIGEGAGTAITSSFYNVFVGAGAGCSSTQSRNVFIGACAGCAQTLGSSNVAIGDGINVPITTGGCQLAIGYGAGFVCWLTGNNTGAIKPGAGIIDCANSCGTVGQYLWTTGANKIVWSASSPSDTRDKEILGPVPTALPVVQQIEPITYRWKERESDVAQEEVIYGFSAQQLQEVDSILVDNSDPDHLRIHDRKIVPLLVKAIQELSAKVEALEAKLEANG